MSARDIVGGLAGAALSAAKNPIGTARKVVGTGVAATEAVAHSAADHLRQRQGATGTSDLSSDPGQARTEEQPAEKAAEKSAPKASPKGSPESKAKPEPTEAEEQAHSERSDDGPRIVLAEPAPPEEPPVDIVEQVLAAEARQERFGRTTEPRGASRDEEHGEAGLQRAELDEIAEETAEALPGGDLDIETPVGTTGADVGYNPDTAEADLQQPGTEGIVDPATAKTLKAETRTGTKGAKSKKS